MAESRLVPLKLINLTTAQRDALSPAVGDTIYNTTTTQAETYNGIGWAGPRIQTQSIWAANGDLLIGTANDTGTILPVSAVAGQAVTASPVATNLLGWGNPLSAADANAGGGLVASYNRLHIASSATAAAATSGTLRIYAIVLPAGITVTTVTFWAGSTAGATLTHSWATLMSSGRVQRALSSDVTTATWTASALRAFTMTTPYQVTATGILYVGLCIVGTTIPTIEAVDGLRTAGARLVAPRAGGDADTGLTTPATCPGTATTPTMLTQYPYFEIS